MKAEKSSCMSVAEVRDAVMMEEGGYDLEETTIEEAMSVWEPTIRGEIIFQM